MNFMHTFEVIARTVKLLNSCMYRKLMLLNPFPVTDLQLEVELMH